MDQVHEKFNDLSSMLSTEVHTINKESVKESHSENKKEECKSCIELIEKIEDISLLCESLKRKFYCEILKELPIFCSKAWARPAILNLMKSTFFEM